MARCIAEANSSLSVRRTWYCVDMDWDTNSLCSLQHEIAHTTNVCPSIRIRTWFPLVRRVLSSVIGSQLISDYISATRCSVVPHTASPVFPPLKYGVAHARNFCPGVLIRTWFPLVRRVLSSVIGSQLISDYISATRCSVVPCNASPSFSATQVWSSPCANGLSQCTDNNMIPTCAQSSVFCDCLTINFLLYFRYSTYCGAMQISSSYFMTQGRSDPCDKYRSVSMYG